MRIKFNDIILETNPESVYVPAEDTFFLEDCIIEYFSFRPTKILNMCDMGTGTGYIGIRLKKIFKDAELHAIDKNRIALKLCHKNFALNQINGLPIYSNLFDYYLSNKISIKFDLIVFNPPYLPSKNEFKNNISLNGALEGGKNGIAVIKIFLKQFSTFIQDTGLCFLVLSNFNQPSNILNKYPEYILKAKFQKRILLESLTVIVISLRNKNEFIREK